MGYYDRATSSYKGTALLLSPATDYLVIIKKVGTTFEWVLRDLVAETEQTETTSDNTYDSGQITQAWFMSNAQTGLNGISLSNAATLSSLEVDDIATIKQWMIQKYSGDPVPGVADPDATDAMFFLQLDIDTK